VEADQAIDTKADWKGQAKSKRQNDDQRHTLRADHGVQMGLPSEDPVQALLHHGMAEAEDVGGAGSVEAHNGCRDIESLLFRHGEDGLSIDR